MSPHDALKTLRQESLIANNFPVTHLNSPTVFETKNGALGTVIKVQGHAFDTQTTSVLNQLKMTWHRALCALDENYCVYVTLHRHRINTTLAGQFNNTFAQKLDNKYHAKYQRQPMFQNEIYITLLHKGITSGNMGKGLSLFHQLSDKTMKSERVLRRAANLQSLANAVRQLVTALACFSPQVLGAKDDDLGYSELLRFLGLVINGGKFIPFKQPTHASPLATTLVKAKKYNAVYPQGNISHYLSSQAIYFGKHLLFQGYGEQDNRYGAILSLKRYSTETASLMLDPLLLLDAEFIVTHSFAVEVRDVAQKKINLQQRKLENSNDPALSQIDALTEAKDHLQSDVIKMGFHHHTLMLLADSQSHLETLIAKAAKCYLDAGMVAVRERLGMQPAFWAQIPGNLKFIARSSLISSENFVDFAPLHNYPSGFKDKNHLGSAVTLMETPAKTAFFFNLHSQGAKDNPSPGHTTLIGGNGSGKTVMMGFLDAQLNRYGGRSVFFDRNRGLEIYVRACGGYYGVLSPDHHHEIQFNPLQLPDTPTNRKFCREWLAQLVIRENETEIDDESLDAIAECIDYGFTHLDKRKRNLTTVTQHLPIHFPRWKRLRRWLRANDKYAAGEYAYLFDNDEDALELQTKMGFDMTHFLDKEPPTVLAALTLYLFHRIESALDGALYSIFLDEGWQYLNNTYWQKKLNEWLPTLRKLNCHLIFATQSPASVVNSPIASMILDNCATNIFFPNPQAKAAHYIDGFNLTDAEYDCIRSNTPQSRLFLYKQGHTSTLLRLELSQLRDELALFSGTAASVDLLTKIRKQWGDNPDVWLPLFLKQLKFEGEANHG